ncbi:MAG: excinuclease ABC subunit UvrA [Lachnospiraceae bacterium]|nr:excinuclease ABC subunit UvrA [Lachnospiraceae bacterium]
MALRELTVRGARVHNLKNVTLTIPRDKLVVFTGLSGSGKSSLAFDTIYAEGHRRFVESLSSYARMFLGQLDKPDIDSIEGLSPAISIDQKTTSRNPRSTVGTVTEIYDYLRLLYARVGIPHCPICGREIRQQTVDQILDRILELPSGTRFMVLAPVVRGKKGMHEKVFDSAKKAGYVRARVDGVLTELGQEIGLDKNKKHTIEIVVDRLSIRDDVRSRLSDSVETALNLAEGNLVISVVLREGETFGGEAGPRFSQSYACEEHGISVGELSPRMFSFNNPFGACEACSGLGEMRVISPERVIPDESLTLREGAIQVNGFKTLDEYSYNGPLFLAAGKAHGFDLDTPFRDLSEEAKHAILYGTGDERYDVVRYFDNTSKRQLAKFDGVLKMIQDRFDMGQNEYYEDFIEEVTCPKCGGKRLKPEVLAVTVGGKNIHDFCAQSVTEALAFVKEMKLTKTEQTIAAEITKELKSRLGFLENVGLEYLTLTRKAGSLSGGEAQRIRLATQIGSSLMGVLYILDEPSIGLHQRDNHKLIETLKKLRDVGNSVIVVEHDEETMLESDYIVDIGPGAGIHGGEIVAQGTPEEIMANPVSLTGLYLSHKKEIKIPETRRPGNGKYLTVYGAEEHNLKKIDVAFPLGTFTCVTGVSGSGKSSLVNGILMNKLAHDLNRAYTHAGKHDRIEGIENLDKVISIDQSPIGRTPRSNPATYTGLFNEIRDLYASTPDAKQRGYGPGRFSFNVKGGRCEACQGDGVKCIEMHFLPDVYVTCDVCKGKRYNRDTLEVKYKGKNIYDVLDMTVEEGLAFFEHLPRLARKLRTLNDVGLGYIKIGQSSVTLSGGEAQRVKLATELSKRATGRTVYILDEPTTGLHSADVDRLIEVLQRLVDAGNTVIVIEHNLDLIKTADYIVDLGPEGGDRGGTLVASGTPEEVAACEASYTGQFLGRVLSQKS